MQVMKIKEEMKVHGAANEENTEMAKISHGSKMPSEDELSDLASLYKIFGDVTRLRILYSLANGERCVCDIAQSLDMSVSAISHQLRSLRQSNLVKKRRDGKTAYYSLADDHIHTIILMGLEHINE